MTRRLLVALGIVAFLAFLVVTLPAQLLLGQLDRFAVKATGVSGSIWKGQAADLRVQAVDLGQLTWDLHVLEVFTGRLSAGVTLKQGDAFANGDVAATLRGRVELRGLTASWPLAALSGGGVPAGWNGTVNLRLDALALAAGVPVDLTGAVDVMNLVGPANRPANLGSFRATFPAEAASGNNAAGVTGTLQDLEGPLEIAARIRIGNDRSYVIDGQIATRPNTPASVVNALQYLGEPDAQGRRPFSIAGTF